MVIKEKIMTIITGASNNMINDEDFKNKFKKDEKAFSRNRKLTFPNMMAFILRKSVKSLQNSLNEFYDEFNKDSETITASAFSQARQKLLHTAFIELNQKAVLDNIYNKTNEIKTYKGLRLLGIDGCKIRLPDSSEIAKEYGQVKNINKGVELGRYSGAIVSVMYDLLNNYAIDSKLENLNRYEGDMAIEHLESCAEKDLIIGDRGYPSYKLLATILDKGLDFLFRCSPMFYKEGQSLLIGDIDSAIYTMKISDNAKGFDLPKEIKVRFLQVILNSGEVEILVTSLLSDEEYPTADFKGLYWRRWGIETFYDVIKNRLNLENFTGKSVEAVKQDFYSTIYISNYETSMVESADQILEERSKNSMHKLKTNKAVTFNTLKNNIFNLFLSNNYSDEVLHKKINKMFLQTPTVIRENRIFERNPTTSKALNHVKRRGKICF